MFALAVYDIVRGSSTPNLMVGAAVGGRELLRAVFDATGAADITTTAANANSAFEGLDSWRELPLLQSRQRRNTAPLSRRATWESLTELRKGQALPPMLFAAIGTGEAVVSTTMTFVPSAVIVPPRYRGIQVTKELFVLDALGKRTCCRCHLLPQLPPLICYPFLLPWCRREGCASACAGGVHGGGDHSSDHARCPAGCPYH